ncbi:MAG: C39 family peptidase [Gammaproteobacteria bacterium]|nr:C39 family peptidase [Gammaproteobacteria bacterium]
MADWAGFTNEQLLAELARLTAECVTLQVEALRRAMGRASSTVRVSLDVPHVIQWGPGANRSPGDCGPACTTKLVHHLTEHRPTVDEVAIAAGQPEGSHYTTLAQLAAGAAKYGLVLQWQRPLKLDAIRAELDADKPVLVLIHYGALAGRLDQGYTGGHFVVVVGYGRDEEGEYFLLNDPDWWGDRAAEGDHWRVTATELDAALDECSLDGNRNYQGLVIR